LFPLSFYGGQEREAYSLEMFVAQVGVKYICSAYAYHCAAGDDLGTISRQLLAVSGANSQEPTANN